VLWEALTLRRLFRGASENETMRMVLTLDIERPSTINPECPPELDPIVMRALERDPVFRYATAKELARDIEEVLRHSAYGGRTTIADYMQFTFAAHIARQRLLQEVSTEVARAPGCSRQFAEPDPAISNRGTRRPPASSIAFRRPTSATDAGRAAFGPRLVTASAAAAPARPGRDPRAPPGRRDDRGGTPRASRRACRSTCSRRRPRSLRNPRSRSSAARPTSCLPSWCCCRWASLRRANAAPRSSWRTSSRRRSTRPRRSTTKPPRLEIACGSLKRAIADVLDRFEAPADEPAPAIPEAPLIPERISSPRLRPPSLKPATHLVVPDGGATRVERSARGVSPVLAAALIGGVALVFIILLMLR
jgi:hypothetical protein